MLIDNVHYVERGPTIEVKTLSAAAYRGVAVTLWSRVPYLAVKPAWSLRTRRINLADLQAVEFRGDLFEPDHGGSDLDQSSAQLRAFIEKRAAA